MNIKDIYEIATGKRENNLMYLKKTSKKAMYGPLYHDGWHHWNKFDRWKSNRKKVRFTRETIRKMDIS